jgi:hypothetical protein
MISGITTAQNNANVEMGRSLVGRKKKKRKKKVTWQSYVITDVYQRFL